jgi:hypothetical protein
MYPITKVVAQEPGFAFRYVEQKPAMDTIDISDDWNCHNVSRKLVTIAALPFTSPGASGHASGSLNHEALLAVST